MTSIHPEPTFAPISFVNATSLPASLSLSGRTAVVTGSSSGLGRSISLRLARLGCIVVCADLAPSSSATAKLPGALSKPTHELINENGGTGYFQKLDVTDYSAVEGVVRFAVDQASPNKRLDIMVNNAGIPGFLAGKGSALIHTEDPAQAEKIIKVNLMGIWNGTKAAVTQMLEQDILSFPVDLDLSVELGDNPTLEVEAQQQGEPPQRGSRGVIVNMGSIHGMVCGPAEPTYSSSKGAVINLSRTVAIDYAPQRINVNCVCPGSGGTTAYQSDHSNGSNYGYTPSSEWCIPFIVLFALSGVVHAIQAYISKYWVIYPTLFTAALIEVIGRSGRERSNKNVTLVDPFLMQIVTLKMAPVFFSASTLFSDRNFTSFVFLIDNTIACILQAVGGGLASGSAATGSPTNTSTNIMVAGIIFQPVSMVVFVGLGFDFVIRASTRRPYAFRLRQISSAAAKRLGNEKTTANSTMEGDAPGVFEGERENLTRWWIMLSGAMVSSIMIIIRGVYRSAELSQGWSGYIITNQRFIGLDCVTMFIAVAVFNVIHPMFLLPKKTSWKGYH
ncbi:MAG: hypothetical protein TREMPRED_004560 [Tremellales sp. Tagirdzhanova-0007]|nr:MAG: hypothetical protein TREMPRED_004560 [Tremellales sp. Tagirdzhanova-0007]